VKLSRFRKPKTACFLSSVEYRPNTNTINIVCTKKYIESMYEKVGFIVERRKEEKKERKIV
jgi:hypothetical protein